ncbi:MAG TPA: 50S ribosomal protein L11 methyltransferase [Thermoanaerobaculia bacterium]|nr:50S ribosomal protein L11 methyltransferase [Thermoanaerobaculia bacterium]
MDWDTPYQVSRPFSMEISRAGHLVGTSSISRPPQGIELDALPVLLAFADGATPRAVLRRLQEDWELDEDGLADVVEVLLSQAFLVPVARGEEPALASGGFASLLTHQRLVADTVRVQAYRTAILRHGAGKSVVEVGCGSGILSIFAAQAGAARVVAIEESEIAALAEEMFAANGCDGVVELRRANSRDVDLDEPADLIIHEILGSDPFVEALLPAIADARRRLLRPGGRLLPYRIEVCCLGVELEERTYRDRERVLAETREMQGLYGIDFAPFLERLQRVHHHLLPPPVDLNPPFKPRILTEELCLLDLDLYDEAPDLDHQLREVRLRIRESGKLGAVVLFFRAHLDEVVTLSTSPYGPLTSWGYDLRALARRVPVSAGMEVPLALAVENSLGRQRVSLDLA